MKQITLYEIGDRVEYAGKEGVVAGSSVRIEDWKAKSYSINIHRTYVVFGNPALNKPIALPTSALKLITD